MINFTTTIIRLTRSLGKENNEGIKRVKER